MEKCTVQLYPQEASNFTQTDDLSFTPKLKIPTINNPKNRYETKSWVHFDAVSNEDIGGVSPRHRILDTFWSEITHLVTLMEGYVNYKLNETLELRAVEVVDGYTRFSAEVGREYILDVKFAQVDNNTNIVLKRFRLIRPLDQEILLVPEKTALDVTVNVIVPVHSVNKNFFEFMEAYRLASLHPQENAHLILTVLGKGKNLYNVQTTVANYTKMYPKARVTILAGKGNSSIQGLELGLSVLSEGELAFLASVNLKIQPGFFATCRKNAVARERMYFPVPFVTYKDQRFDTKAAEFPNWLGRWATYSFEYSCLYKDDYTLLGGDLSTPLFERAIIEEVEVMRAPEHKLIQTLEVKDCNSVAHRRSREVCLFSRASSSVDQVDFSQYLYDFRTVKHRSLKYDVL